MIKIFTHGIYNNIPETNHLSRVAVLRVKIFGTYNAISMCFYITALPKYVPIAQYGCFRYFFIIIMSSLSMTKLLFLLLLLLLLLLLRLASRL